MADVNSVVSGLGSNFKSAFAGTGTYIIYTIILLVFMVIVGIILWLYFDKKSYNTSVIILRPRANTGVFDLEAGYLGKHYVDRAKEVRFKIFQSKKKGIRYNNEAIPQKYVVKRFIGGKYNPLVFMTPNSEGWLQPTMVTLDTANSLLAQVDNADISYYQTELELMDAMFNKKGFIEKYYLLILIFLMIVVVLIQWYAASQIHKSAQLNAQAVQVMSDTLRYVADKFGGNSTTTSQVINLG